MPRKAHKRGHSTHKRGLSREKVCIPCAVDRNGCSIAKIANLGRAATRDIDKVLGGKIKRKSVMCTDMLNSYRGFATNNDLELIQLKGGQNKTGYLSYSAHQFISQRTDNFSFTVQRRVYKIPE